jgi:hypothetical protein
MDLETYDNIEITTVDMIYVPIFIKVNCLVNNSFRVRLKDIHIMYIRYYKISLPYRKILNSRISSVGIILFSLPLP